MCVCVCHFCCLILTLIKIEEQTKRYKLIENGIFKMNSIEEMPHNWISEEKGNKYPNNDKLSLLNFELRISKVLNDFAILVSHVGLDLLHC